MSRIKASKPCFQTNTPHKYMSTYSSSKGKVHYNIVKTINLAKNVHGFTMNDTRRISRDQNMSKTWCFGTFDLDQ